MALINITSNVLRRRLQTVGLCQLNNSRFYSSEEEVAPEPHRKWKHWKDVPDSLIKTYSERDPYNMCYQDPEWAILKKKQLWWTQDMNINPMFPYGKKQHAVWFASFLMIVAGFFYELYKIQKEDIDEYRVKVKQMRENPIEWRTPPEKRGLVYIEPPPK